MVNDLITIQDNMQYAGADDDEEDEKDEENETENGEVSNQRGDHLSDNLNSEVLKTKSNNL